MKIVSCCCRQDLETFKFSYEYIEKYIPNSGFYLFVPDKDYDIFTINLKNFKGLVIRRDSDIISKKNSDIVMNKLILLNKRNMYGWYIQQFIKIKAASKFSENETVIIWDSDTIPLRPLSFKNKNGGHNYFVGSEYHEPYFNTLLNFTSISKQIEHSFIAQCLPIYSHHVRELITELGGDSDWIENIMLNLDESSDCAFSEYETLGNFVLGRYPHLVHINWSSWARNGYQLLFFRRDLKSGLQDLNGKYSYVALEKYNISKFKYIYRLLIAKLGKFKKIILLI